jgi:hypothetical protein
MANYVALKTEIAKTAYNGMTEAQIIATINAGSATTLTTLTLSSSQIYDAIVPAEFQALSAAMQQFVRDIWGLGSGIDVGPASNARTVLAAAFGAGSTSRANLIALLNSTTTIAAGLGFPNGIAEADLVVARAAA